MSTSDTIAAIATALGTGAVAIVRLSGPDALAIADRLFRTKAGVRPRVALADRPSHQIHHGFLHDPVTDAPIDEVLVLVMRNKRSFTGEDVVEFQSHAGTAAGAVLRLVLGEGARLAAAGEFTKRAFLNGRLDLAQAEAVGDVVEARSERALAQALAQLDGRLSREVAGLRAQLVGLLARLEAAIDYPDEIDDVPGPEAVALLTPVRARVAAIKATARMGHVMREGAALVIVGRPNVGKSSLLNALLGRARAIVTDVPGTTRDVLEESLVLGGVPFRVLDTAGIRETTDTVEALGVARSREALAAADVVLLVLDAEAGDAEQAMVAAAAGKPLVIAANKSDLGGSLPRGLAGAPVVAVSAQTGAGMRELEAALVARALGAETGAVSSVAVNARHAASLEAAEASLDAALASAEHGMAADFVAIDLASAIQALGAITGDALADEVIDEVFQRFCVGK